MNNPFRYLETETSLFKVTTTFLLRFVGLASPFVFFFLSSRGLDQLFSIHRPQWLVVSTYVQMLATAIIYTTQFVLQLLGYSTVIQKTIVAIFGTPGVNVSGGCVGFIFWCVMCAFVVAYPGSNEQKAAGIGIVSILLFVLNVTRITMLCIAVKNDYNHVIDTNVHDQFDLILTMACAVYFVLWVMLTPGPRFSKA